uniref:Cathepsin B-like cysteine proteinase (Fragments) n=1 Tax=Fasciola hepatica TaxID=6192 RepID=CYSB_FASHE|nr:RecName: Full=Cathepsin B-like cysteine proteinase; AltName: Full=Newly excysted juvenile proteins 5 and 7; Flags: Precursor [Fasciola hepatica]
KPNYKRQFEPFSDELIHYINLEDLPESFDARQ